MILLRFYCMICGGSEITRAFAPSPIARSLMQSRADLAVPGWCRSCLDHPDRADLLEAELNAAGWYRQDDDSWMQVLH